MTYALLKLAHLLGAILIGSGLIGVWVSDLRSRQHSDLVRFSEAVLNIGVFYDSLVVPGALLLLGSGGWMIYRFFGGWDFVGIPWLAGMVGLFAFEFIEGNTITRVYFMRIRRLTEEALHLGRFTPELEKARSKPLPTFTHFLDLPVLLLIVALGTIKPGTWRLFIAGSAVSLAIAAALTIAVPRLYPREPKS